MIQIVALALVTAILAAGCETPKAPGIAEPLAVDVNQPKLEEAIEASLKARDWKIIEHTGGRYFDDGANAYGSRNSKVQSAYQRWIDILHTDIETRLRRS